MNTILYKFSGVAGIFFPVGKLNDGGTCEFASKKCIKECAAFKNVTSNNKIPYREKLETYRYITETRIGNIINRIVKEMQKMDTKILYWFASGDCPKKYTQHITKLIKGLSKRNEINAQQGFTRNIKLWKNLSENKKIHFVFTVENSDNIPDNIRGKGLFGIPNYRIGKVKIIQYNWHISKPKWEYNFNCGNPWGSAYSNKSYTYWEESNNIKHGFDCQACYDKKEGCYTPKKETVTTKRV